jgi:antitoxin component of MazEF toxin-antitoxin module
MTEANLLRQKLVVGLYTSLPNDVANDVMVKIDEYVDKVMEAKDEKILLLVTQKRALEDLLSERINAIRPDQFKQKAVNEDN